MLPRINRQKTPDSDTDSNFNERLARFDVLDPFGSDDDLLGETTLNDILNETEKKETERSKIGWRIRIIYYL